MFCDEVSVRAAGRDARAGDDQRHLDVGVERGELAGVQVVYSPL